LKPLRDEINKQKEAKRVAENQVLKALIQANNKKVNDLDRLIDREVQESQEAHEAQERKWQAECPQEIKKISFIRR
jgi:cellobiose-specific phosphotransferase system component IIA